VARFQVLALDGGGIRGVFSAALLADFEKRFNTNITDHFDLIVGTSTGGIIALGLGLGLSAQQILDFYRENGAAIFPSLIPSHLRRIPGVGFLEPRNYSSIFRRKFSNLPLESALKKAFGENTPLGRSTKRLAITSYDLQRSSVKLFKTAHHERFRSDYKLPAWQVALATSAAPTYFRAAEANERFLVDGGLWGNNPIMVGVTEAIGVLKQSPKEIRVMSVGTLDEIRTLSRRNVWGGKILWAKPAIDSMMTGQAIAAHGQASLLIGSENILRINPPVPAGYYQMDDASCMRELVGIACGEAEHRSPDFERLFLSHKAQPFSPVYEVAA
jgi:patatin-like phospholipase/acyl hydrolase